MASYGITATGYNKKTLQDIIAELEKYYKQQEVFGTDLDFTQQSDFYQLIYPIAQMIAEAWELDENNFYSQSPIGAEGNGLRYLGKIIGISAKQATRARGIIRIAGVQGTQIPQGFLIASETLITFRTLTDVTITINGYVDVEIECIESGAKGNVPANTITKVINPRLGISSVTNTLATEGGQDAESDLEFRQKFESATKGMGGSTTDAIRNEILKLQAVESCVVTENDTDNIVDGINPHSIFILVKGGNNQDIANAILKSKAAASGTTGNIQVTATDTQGVTHTYYINRPVDVDIYVKATITKNYNYPADGDTLIKNAIIEYINTLKIGEDVVIYKLITYIANKGVEGVEDIQVQLSKDNATFTPNNIVISNTENAISDIGKVVII